MIHIMLKGVDEFLGAHVEIALTPIVAKVCRVKDDDVYCTCIHSMIYHKGVDQTSFHMIVMVELPQVYQKYEKELADEILKASKNFSVHCHVQFQYLNGTIYERLDKEYPLFVTEQNSVQVQETESEDEEIYTENIFAEFDQQMKGLKK